MFPTFTALTSAWLFLLLIPLIAFYFLKLKRPRQVVPSLVLWRQVLADQRVNSPFQRFKRNLLLLLQILLLLLLVLAAMRPVLQRSTSSATRLPILIDTSASMAALDQPGGKTRLQAAKDRIRELLDGLPADQQVCLVAFARTARRLTGFTNNRTELNDALDSLSVDDVPGDLEEALRLVQALSRTEPFDRVWLFSDGNVPARTNFELSYQIDFQRLPEGGSNFGITTFNARRANGWEVFVQLGGSQSAESTTGTLELREGDRVIGRERVSLVKGAAPRLSFRIDASQPTSLEARFIPEGFDSLAADNAAWLELPAARPLSVFVAKSLPALRHGFEVLDGVNLYPDAIGGTQAGYDLVISDEAADLALPARVTCGVGQIPAELKELVSLGADNGSIIDWRRDSPLLQHVSFDDVVLSEDPTLAPDVTESNFRELGYEILADALHGPAIVERQAGETTQIAFLFHPERSTLPYRVGFPVLISNLAQIAVKQSHLGEIESAHTGVLPALSVAPSKSYRITGPDGESNEAASDAQGRLSGLAAPKTGEYVITGGAEPMRLGASLLSPAETSLAAIEQIEFNERLKVAVATEVPQTDRALWWPLSLIALVILMIEWWWFNRRPSLSVAR
ncbi:MAG: VWA domain-containing protein [Chthoniobacteraceae bacterium]